MNKSYLPSDRLLKKYLNDIYQCLEDYTDNDLNKLKYRNLKIYYRLQKISKLNKKTMYLPFINYDNQGLERTLINIKRDIIIMEGNIITSNL